MNAFACLVRRETWEHKALYRAPIITGVALVSMVLLALVQQAINGSLNRGMAEHGLTDDILAPHYLQLISPIIMYALIVLIFLVSTVVAIFYLLDCLYAERKNRSILFWKSLPISDAEAVFAKLAAATLLVPFVAIAAVVAGWITLQLIAAVTIGLLGGNGWLVLWQPAALFSGIAIAIESSAGFFLWLLPVAGWLLLVSAWARRLVFLWAVLPPAVIIFVEKWFFETRYFFDLLAERLFVLKLMVSDAASSIDLVKRSMSGSTDVSVPEAINQMVSLTKLFSEPGLYGGILVAAVFITGAIFLRRYRDET